MNTIPLPIPGSVLEYTSPVAGWPWAAQIVSLTLMLLLALSLVLFLYRTESRRIARPFALGLLALRSMLILAVLTAFLFDPQWTKVRRETVPGRVLVAVDMSESMGVIDLERGDSLPRIELAHRIAQQLNQELKNKHSVELVGFDQTLEPFRTPVAKGQASDLKLPLVRAADIASDSQSRLIGVVLLTDGRHNWGRSPLSSARELASKNVPVYPIPMAPDVPPTDLAVLEAQAQASTVFQGTIVPVEVAVRATRWPKGPIRVSLERSPDESGKKPLPIVETVNHPGGDATHRLTLRVKLDQPGPQTLTVVAESTNANDRFPSNNRRTVRVNAVKERAKVLLVDGEARWEFHYLHTALGRDPNMDVRSVVFRQPRVTPATDDDIRKFGIPARKLPAEVDSLSAYDCIVLGDVEPEQMTMADRERLEKFVAETGGTLVIVAGKRAMPFAYTKDEKDPIRRLLPLQDPKVWSEKLGFRLTPTLEGTASWFLQLSSNRGESQALWEQFPPHFWAVTGEAKAGAEVLAAADGHPLIARQNYGFGRVLYLGIDSTWRWRYKVGDRYHHRFWGQVAQWAASDRLLPTSNPVGTIRFGTREPAFQPSQPVEIIVRSTDEAPALKPSSLQGARVLQRTGEDWKPLATFPLVAAEGRPRELRAAAHDLPPGRYRVELEIPDWAGQLLDATGKRLGAEFEVLPFEGEEMLELSANRPLLNELAAATKGRMFEPAEAKDLIELLLSQSAEVEQRTVRPLRSSWWSFATVLLLLCCEWALRKWAGLP